MTQVDRIQRHLEDGKTITPMAAITVYGIFRLSSVIEDLRHRGMEIDCILKRDEMGKQYGEYRVRAPIHLGAFVQVKPGNGIGLPAWVRSLKDAKVIGAKPAMTNFKPAWFVRFVRGQNMQDLWLLDTELTRTS